MTYRTLIDSGNGDGYDEGDGHSHGYVHCILPRHYLEDFYEYADSEKFVVGSGIYNLGFWWLECLVEVLPMLSACEIGVDLVNVTRLVKC